MWQLKSKKGSYCIKISSQQWGGIVFLLRRLVKMRSDTVLLTLPSSLALVTVLGHAVYTGCHVWTTLSGGSCSNAADGGPEKTHTLSFAFPFAGADKLANAHKRARAF